MDSLVKHLISFGVLKTPNLINAFHKIDRADFVPEEVRKLAYEDTALSIYFGQTISQPYTVAFMLELLRPKPGENILDIGFGSGWQTAILAHCVSQDNLKAPAHGRLVLGEKNQNYKNGGQIYALELIPELCEFGRKNLKKYSFIKSGVVKIFCKNAARGLPEAAKEIGGFDKIIAAAALSSDIPEVWKKQLKAHGIIVAPIKNSIWRFVKKSENEFVGEEFPGFVFVPFV